MTDVASMLSAASVDPAPVTAWLILVVTAFAVIAGVGAVIAFGWWWIAMPQIKAAIATELANHDREHVAEHAELEHRIEATRDDLHERVDAETAARSVSIGRAHDRIDNILARPAQP